MPPRSVPNSLLQMEVLFFSRLCPERKLLSDSSSNPYRTEVTFVTARGQVARGAKNKKLRYGFIKISCSYRQKGTAASAYGENKICLNNFVTPCMLQNTPRPRFIKTPHFGNTECDRYLRTNGDMETKVSILYDNINALE